MSNFTKWHLLHEIFRILPLFSQFLRNLTFIFSGSHAKLSLVLLPITNYIYSPWKVLKRVWYCKVFVEWKLKLLNLLMDSILTCQWISFTFSRAPFIFIVFQPIEFFNHLELKNRKTRLGSSVKLFQDLYRKSWSSNRSVLDYRKVPYENLQYSY